MTSEFERQFDAFKSRHIKRNVNRFWEVFETINLPRDEAEEWCAMPQYGMNLRTIFEAIDDNDWKDIEDAIERLNLYA